MIPHRLVTVLRDWKGNTADRTFDAKDNAFGRSMGRGRVASDIVIDPIRQGCAAMGWVNVHAVVRIFLEQLFGPIRQPVRIVPVIGSGDGKERLLTREGIGPRRALPVARRACRVAARPCRNGARRVTRPLGTYGRKRGL